MWNAAQLFLGVALLVASCGRGGLPGGRAGGAAGFGGVGAVGGGGATGMAAACAGASDARLVIAEQRILRLTINQAMNTVRYLFGDAEATALVRDGVIGVGDDDSVDVNRRFPPLQDPYIRDATFTKLDRVADHVTTYVLANFAAVTACAPASDACATTYLTKLAARAYRRQLTSDERARLTTLYNHLRSPQTVNGYQVAFTVEEATSYAVNALVSAPQILWRWEVGDPAMAAISPAGVPLTDHELATQVSFFLTDQPPDDALLAAASAGTLRANLPAHVDDLLATQAARDWLRTIIETYFRINRLAAAPIDPNMFPFLSPALTADLGVEARKFLDNALWNGDLTDLLLSRTTFLNSQLAATFYTVPSPAGATPTSFVRTVLPADQRSGLLTNPAFLMANARADREGMLARRGALVASTLLCTEVAYHDANTQVGIPTPQSAQEEVAHRAAQPSCNACHGQFDPYGLALDNYDVLGRYRTVDDRGHPVDTHTRLPAALGGDAVANAVELAQKLATKPAFTNCMARALLQYALADTSAIVEVPLPPQQAGCATADVVDRYRGADGKTFTDLVRATVAAPAFVLRRAAP